MKAIISVLGGDKPGIIAEISGCLYRYNINILDITQTILSGYFTMVMMVDLSGMSCGFDEIIGELNKLGEKMGLEIRMQRSEIFDAMHRL
ncbi:MAG: ACT domain-containing protein [Clostridia bacterium]|nr:ACT domain-containing protein [Clostridia bacterium]